MKGPEIKWITLECSHLQTEFGGILQNISWGPLKEATHLICARGTLLTQANTVSGPEKEQRAFSEPKSFETTTLLCNQHL